MFRNLRVGSNSPSLRKKDVKKPDKLKKLEQAYINEKKAIKAKHNHQGKVPMRHGGQVIENKGRHAHVKANRVVI